MIDEQVQGTSLKEGLPTEGIRHYAHPIDLSKYWCGAPREPKPLGPLTPIPCTCVVCEDIHRTYGTWGWLAGMGPAA